jgi:alkanesulfonate monooxygenase SsuD/methylene tetrahydromethanopterin reductase-like flavin-dependent oxidoreductase (luciferase family)
MWTQEKATFKGRYHSVKDALCYPHPVQKPHIPIWVGGTGDLLLKVSAKHADAVNFAWSQSHEFFEERLQVLKNHCTKIGRDFNEIKKSAGLRVRFTDNESPEALAERIGEYASLGIDHFILLFSYGEEIEKMRFFIEEVKDKI